MAETAWCSRQTELLYPGIDDGQAISAAKHRLCTDLAVGGVVLRRFFDFEDTRLFTENDGAGFGDHPKVQWLLTRLGCVDGTVDHVQTFTSPTNWHIFYGEANRPKLRLWSHMQGRAALWLARAQDNTPFSGDIDGVALKKHAYRYPIVFRANNPGDVVVFVDAPSEGVTGTGTFHRTDILSSEEPRLTVVGDVYIEPIQA